ncbi:MAG: hypothetical protein HUJ53_02710 [Holdemanella sp.]|nr:hypothetical protein [Holdemanella sp.]
MTLNELTAYESLKNKKDLTRKEKKKFKKLKKKHKEENKIRREYQTRRIKKWVKIGKILLKLIK